MWSVRDASFFFQRNASLLYVVPLWAFFSPYHAETNPSIPEKEAINATLGVTSNQVKCTPPSLKSHPPLLFPFSSLSLFLLFFYHSSRQSIDNNLGTIPTINRDLVYQQMGLRCNCLFLILSRNHSFPTFLLQLSRTSITYFSFFLLSRILSSIYIVLSLTRHLLNIIFVI